MIWDVNRIQGARTTLAAIDPSLVLVLDVGFDFTICRELYILTDVL